MREHWVLLMLLIPANVIRAVRKPIGKREVDRLIEIELNEVNLIDAQNQTLSLYVPHG